MYDGSTAGQRLPLAEIGKLRAVCRGLRPQFGGPEHAAVFVEYVQASAAGVHETLRVADRFRVQNVGAASADNIGLDTRIYQRSIPTFPPTDAVSTIQSGDGGSIAFLGQDGGKEITVVCTPLAGYLCDGARLNAVVADDLDPSNNAATGE